MSKRVRIVYASMTLWMICAAAHAVEDDGEEPAAATRPAPASPRFKVSYRRFSIAGLEKSPLWLQGAQVDAYALSQRWIRVGIELEGGNGSATWAGTAASVSYGIVGVTVGVQLPARVTPFVEGRFVSGILFGEVNGIIPVGVTSIMDRSAATWIYAGGLETGVEVYIHRRLYLSGAMGWMRSTWHGIDVVATTPNPASGVAYKDLVGDTFTVKLGLGF